MAAVSFSVGLAWTDADSGNFPDSNLAEQASVALPIEASRLPTGKTWALRLAGTGACWRSLGMDGRAGRPELVARIRGATKVVTPSYATSPVVTA